MKIFKITYKVTDTFNPDIYEINHMAVEAKNEKLAIGRVIAVAYRVTLFSEPKIEVVKVD